MELRIGSIIAETYAIEAVLGRGGMGAVFRASHTRLPDKKVAIKVLRADQTDDEALRRFEREALIASKLAHPNIVAVHDFNMLPDRTPYLVLELLEGETLHDRLRRGPIPLAEALPIVRQIGAAIAAAHRHGIVHRDLKPQNIFLVPAEHDGRPTELVKVLDFGISKIQGSQTQLTQDSALLGTPQYMSPEQASGQHDQVDARTDIFALGAIVFEMLSGRPAYAGATLAELVFKLMFEDAPTLRVAAPHIPPSVADTVSRAMSRSRDARFTTVDELVEALGLVALGASGVRAQVAPPPGASQVGFAPTQATTGPTHAPSAPTAARSAGRRVALIAGGAALVGGALAVTLVLARGGGGGGGDPPADPAPATVAGSPAPPTPTPTPTPTPVPPAPPDAAGSSALPADPADAARARYEQLVLGLAPCRVVDAQIERGCPAHAELTREIEALRKAAPQLADHGAELGRKLLGHDAPAVRLQAAQLLPRRRLEDQDLLAAAGEREPDPEVRAALVSLVGEAARGNGKVAAFVLASADHAARQVRIHTARALGRAGFRPDKLAAMITEDPEPAVRVAACESGGALGDKVLVAAFEQATASAEPPQVYAACMTGLVAMFLDWPFYKNHDEAAYRLFLKRLAATPRTEAVPPWQVMGKLKAYTPRGSGSTQEAFERWKRLAPWFDPAAVKRALADVVRDPDAYWMARKGAIEAIAALGATKAELVAFKRHFGATGLDRATTELIDKLAASP